MMELKKIDNVAYIRFSSVYREFQDISEFQKHIDDLKNKCEIFFNYPLTIIINSIESLGKYFLLIFLTFKSLNQWKQNLTNILKPMIVIGIKSIPIVIFTSLFSGMVAGLQAAYQFDVDTGFPITKEAIISRECCWNFSCFRAWSYDYCIGNEGKIGATICAEIGTMRITEQIDALESLSFNPIAYLVMPRILAAIIMFPYLVIVSDIFWYNRWFGCKYICIYEPLTVTLFFQGLEIYGHIETDSLVGLVKGLFFGFSITSIVCLAKVTMLKVCFWSW